MPFDLAGFKTQLVERGVTDDPVPRVIGDSRADAMPRDVLEARRIVAEYVRDGRRLPDDLHEASLLLELAVAPFDLGVTRALVAIRDRLGKPPMPDPPSDGASSGDVEQLLREGERLSQDGDIFWDYACLWQIVTRYPHSARGWAEYARRFAQRRDWVNCRRAAARVLGWPTAVDRSSAVALLDALETLAFNNQLAELPWQCWLKKLPECWRSHPSAAALRLWAGDIEGAVDLLPSVLQTARSDARDWVVAANLAFEQERWDDAYEYWRRAFETDLLAALRSAFNEHSSRLSCTLLRAGKADELADWLSRQSNEREGINLIPPLRSPEWEPRTRKLRERAMERGLPSVLMAAQPQSGHISIANILASGFGLAFATYSLIDAAIVAPWLRDYLRGGASYVTHLMPSERNISLLAKSGAPKIIVHVRDPRQAVVSFGRQLQQYPFEVVPSCRASGGGRLRDAIGISFEERMAYVVSWIDGWVGARDRLNVEFTSFEEFARDRDGFVDRLLSLYGGDRRYFDARQGLREHPGIDYHRRVGRVDEWRDILTREQIDRINRAIPDRLWNAFDWEP